MDPQKSGAIPISQRDKNDGWLPNPRDISTTPGGTMYATTPGGTRIVYDRNALLLIRQSPLAKTPTNLPPIPGVTVGSEEPIVTERKGSLSQNKEIHEEEDPELFQMDS